MPSTRTELSTRSWADARWFRLIAILFGVLGPVGSLVALNGGHGLRTWTNWTSVYVLSTSAILGAWQWGRLRTRDGAAFVAGALGLAGTLAAWGGLALHGFTLHACEDLWNGTCTLAVAAPHLLILPAACAHLGTAWGAFVRAEVVRPGDEPGLSMVLGAFSPALLAVCVDFVGRMRMGL